MILQSQKVIIAIRIRIPVPTRTLCNYEEYFNGELRAKIIRLNVFQRRVHPEFVIQQSVIFYISILHLKGINY